MSAETPDARPHRERVREQMRRQTTAEIEGAAFALLDAGGLGAVSLAAVGKAMGMTPPALYRYFASREALVDALVTAAYADLGSTVAAAGRDAAGSDQGPERVARIAREYRAWALANPRRYMMLYTDRLPDAQDPVDGVAAVNRAMLALLEALTGTTPREPGHDDSALDEALDRWGRAIGAPAGASPPVLRLGVLLWSRVHGLVTLEISGAFASMGLDVGSLLEAELSTVVGPAGDRRAD